VLKLNWAWQAASDPDQEFICFIGSESLLYTFQRILHTLRVTGIIKIVQKTKRNSIVEYLEIRYPFQLCVLGALRECIDETNTYQLQCFSSMKIVGAVGVTDLGGLWALKWSACYIHSDGSSIPLPTNLVHPFTVRVTGIKASNNSRKF